MTHTRNALSQVVATNVAIGGSPPLVRQVYTFDDESDRPRSMTQSGSAVTTKRVEFDYAAGQAVLSEIRRFNAGGASSVLTSRYDFSDLGYLSTIDHTDRDGTSLNRYSLDYDENGYITEIESLVDRTIYTYDTRNQLISADHTAPELPDEVYGYDEAGNRNQSSHHGGAYSTNDPNELVMAGELEFVYDAEGNLIQTINSENGLTQTFEWDFRNRLTNVELRGGDGTLLQVVRYTYDPLDRRVAKSVDITPEDTNPPDIEYYTYIEDQISIVWSAAAPAQPVSVETVYLYGIETDQVLAQDFGSGNYQWLLGDHQNTIRDVAAPEGQWVGEFFVDSFGQLLRKRLTISKAVSCLSAASSMTRRG